MNEKALQPPEKLLRYPHMFPLDIAIWERFLDEYGLLYKGFKYDVKVGRGTDPIGKVPEHYARMQRELSRYRIDAVGLREDRIEVLEVKPNASAGALGQVITYLQLFVKDYPQDLPVVGGIVTDRVRPDMEDLCNDNQLLYYVV